ncbi:hypothetical protein BB561_003899 [Smittium simulii]|uniref:Calcium-transporting ATPase n=1 Tax=Smittium simulii TaxID=133385 RepID=A0A2T9YJ03_9FUNG|nr:hypothetical protein BB561_003899 [Smittium simulii]
MTAESFYLLQEDQILDLFDVSIQTGLNDEQIESRLLEYGKNKLPKEKGKSMFVLILEQFQDKLVLILLGAAIVSFILAFFEEGELQFTSFVEPLVILLILIANATIGVMQETNAEHALEALLEFSPDEATVVRMGCESKINASELVPGDIIKISVGDQVPADCRILKLDSSLLKIEQAILTGESNSVNKISSPIEIKNAVKQEQLNIAFSGTTVVSGRATAIVVCTGIHTAIGNIHNSISQHEAEPTPLEKKLDDFGDMLAQVITVICILVWVINIRHFNEPSHHGWLKGAIYYFKIAVALAVAAIPEGLAVVITTCLALGTQRMAKKNAIVRTLPSVETLGCTSVICSDKTGTLTTNQMSAQYMIIAKDDNTLSEYNIEGTTFEPTGNIINSQNKIVNYPAQNNQVIQEIAEISAQCNLSNLTFNESTNTFGHTGESTEAALKTLLEKLGSGSKAFNDKLDHLSTTDRLTACTNWYTNLGERLNILEFTSTRKSMSVLVDYKTSNTSKLLVKGGSEVILEKCNSIRVASADGQAKTVPLTDEIRRQILAKVSEYSVEKSLRTLAFSLIDQPDIQKINSVQDTNDFDAIEQNMTFVGMCAVRDPPRPEVSKAIADCFNAGIRVVVITGDNPGTAESICRSIGIFKPNQDTKGLIYTGRELDSMTRDQQIEAVNRASVFSRTEPNHKRLLVELLQQQGNVVAMTGDGVNDAPALKKANIGISMGSGTDVAKLASDMILADDNFATITMAVSEGRAIYNNTKQFIRYLISSNIGEVVSIFLTVLLNLPEALAPVQLLWVNLVTDGLPATALGFNPPGNLIMRRPPRNSAEPLISGWLLVRYLVIGAYVGIATVFAYSWYYMYDPTGPMIPYGELVKFHSCATRNTIDCSVFSGLHSMVASTMSLSVLVVIEMFNAMNSLSENESLLSLPLTSNMYLVGAIILSMILHFGILYIPALQGVFLVSGLSWNQWMAVVYISLPVILIDEVLKYVSRNYVEKVKPLDLSYEQQMEKKNN